MLPVKYQAPKLTEREAEALAQEWYGLRAAASGLPSERDQNFLLTTDAGEQFVLKIAQTHEQREVLDLQNRALEHLAERAPSLALSRVRAAKTGEDIITITSSDGTRHLMRLLSYVPGKLFARVKPHSSELLRSLGYTLGVMDEALIDFTHPAAQRELKWDLARAAWIRDYLQHITEPQRRALVERFLIEFETKVIPALPRLRTSVIYNDANDYNVIVGDEGAGHQRVIGVIDFGDMARTCTVCDLAIAAAYAMMDKPDPLAAAVQIVAGYHAAFPLTEAEIEALFPLICIRLSISVTNSAYQRKVEPENEYLTISERPAWALLEKLAAINPRFAHYSFRQACGLPACPKTPAIEQWLKDNAERIGRVVEPDLKAGNLLVCDLTVGSRELGNLQDFGDIATLTRNLFDRLQRAGVSVGLGRYNEARPLYTSEIFKSEGNDGPEWRTVHLGFDLFMEAGSPIFAPLDGRVHSFRLNVGPLDYGPTIILEHTVADGALTFYTLYGHLSADSLAGLSEGLKVKRGALIARMGDESINGGWTPHLHFQIITDLLDRVGEFPGVALPSQREVWLSLSPDPNLIVGIPAKCFPAEAMSSEQILSTRAAYIAPSLSISYDQPLQIVRGSMQYLYDADGRVYLDAVNNVPHVGHCHPRVVRAGQEQMAVLNTNTRYLHENLARYAERLCATLPEPLCVCFFVNSGSEANELALRLARARTRHTGMIVVEAGYHGNTTSLIEISPYKFDGPGGAGAPPYVHKVPMPDVYRGEYKRNDARASEKYAAHVAAAVKNLRARGQGVCAFIAESALSCAGQIILPDGYLEAVYQHVREAGGVCIADEVQVGMGRVGTHFWAFETQGVVPDIVTIGKPIGNGHPLGAVVTTPEIAAAFANGMEYFNTFGGGPVACAIGLAVLDVIEEEQLQVNALRVGAHLMDDLRSLIEKHQIIGDVRGLGLFIGIELVRDHVTLEPAPEQAAYVVNRMKERSILLSTDGPLHNVIKIKPPLVFNQANADFLVETLDLILQEDFLRRD